MINKLENDPLVTGILKPLIKIDPKVAAFNRLMDFLKTGSWSPSVNYIMGESRNYSLYVNDQRAIPFVGDGFKHVQRVALWAMRNRADKIKVVALGGSLAESGLYVHGDVSCNAAISRLAAPYLNNNCLLDGDGHFGSRLAPLDGIGAPRYVSVKRSKLAEELLYNDLAIVPLEDNYDGSNKQPKHFLPLIPIVLLNGISGMGVGYSTDILPHKLSDLIDATVCALKGKPIKTLVPHWEKYDLKIDSLGEGKYELWGKVEKLDTSRALITEIPPGLEVDDFRKRLIEMEDNDEILNFVDRSTKNINIEVKFKRGHIGSWDETKLLKFFKLHEKVTERLVVRSWNNLSITRIETPEELVKQFVEWRLGWYSNRYQHLLEKTNDELVYWLLIRAMITSGFMKKLGKFENKAGVESEVRSVADKAKLAATDIHIDRAISLPTYRWTLEFEAEVNAKIVELQNDIVEYEDILAKPERRKAIYLAEVESLKKIKTK
jgi:DNA gyrase/topoisomerase IV subunit A